MPARKTHYQILGVNTDVSTAEIKRAYRRLAKMQHPDTTDADRDAATEEMIRINEAYAILMDVGKRAEYDLHIGINFSSPIPLRNSEFTSLDEDSQRNKYLRTVFYPARQAIGRLLGAYKHQLRELSADPYDDVLLDAFQKYVDEIESTLLKSSNAMTNAATPPPLVGAVQMMRYSIARAADGLEELKYFCTNFNHNHLTMAENLFRISMDLSRQALALSKGK